jgi:hypothetical protein
MMSQMSLELHEMLSQGAALTAILDEDSCARAYRSSMARIIN